MRSWHSFFDMLQFPVKVLFIACVLMGFGEVLANPQIMTIITVNDTVLTISYGLRFAGSFIFANFPLLVVIKMVGRRHDSSTPIFAAILGYIVFLISCSFFAPQTYNNEFYASIIGIEVNMEEFNIVSDTMMYPFQTGLFAAIAVIWCTRFSYRNTRRHSSDGWLGYIDRDTLSVILTMILSIAAGFLLTMFWPLMINLIVNVMRFIAEDITNPINLFVYGIFDRVMALLNLSTISHNAFWFGSYGGSWISESGLNYYGDVGVWTAQQGAMIVSNGAGRLITPYYLINFFAVPAIAIVFWVLNTNPEERKRYFSFMIIAILVSIGFGSILPFEFFLLLTAPFLLVIHLVVSGLLFGILQNIGVFIGYTYNGSLTYANPGSVFNLLAYFNDTYTRGNLYLFLIVGVIVFIFYFLLAYLYYSYLALDFINLGKHTIIDQFLDSIGGLGNVRNLHAGPTKITVKVINPQIVDFNKLHETGVGKIIENRDGYNIYFGSDSIMIRRAVIKRIRGN